MDQARTTISKIFNGEPRSYTRFSLTQNMEGGDSQVEMKLSPETEEEAGSNGVGEHLNHHRESNRRKPPRGPKNICFLMAATLLIFVIGYLIGYLIHRKQDQALPTCDQPEPTVSVFEDDDLKVFEPSGPKQLDWSVVKSMLADRLSLSQVEASLSEFASDDHRAGSPGDEALARKVLRRFNDDNMKTWSDEHYVKLQGLPPSAVNRVTYQGQNLDSLKSYLAYSANGTVQGPVVYAYFGRKEDFEVLYDTGVSLSQTIVLVRAGKITFAEKVANAEKMNASGVLIYPDPADYALSDTAELFGHVHLGTGDPYTPGFPSFNHTQFPPARSSGLPNIVAQTITANMAKTIMRSMGGRNPPRSWADGALPGVVYRLGDGSNVASVEVNNVLVETKIHNVFGVIKGLIDPDRYVVIGAQRDAWGPGFAKSTVGTALLVELARAISELVREGGYMPRRSLVFASWTAGEYGSVGCTEWLEGYLSSLSLKAYSYISLDGVVTGSDTFKASASPLMYGLLSETLKEVKSVTDPEKTIFAQVAGSNWEQSVLEPMEMTNPAYPFLTFSGLPSVSFRFQGSKEYPYLNTLQDTRERLDSATLTNLPKVAQAAAKVAGHMALRLVHDRLLKLSVDKYDRIIRGLVVKIITGVSTLQNSGQLPKTFTSQWMTSASGSYGRGARSLIKAIQTSDLEDTEQCRMFNDRLMRVEASLLSPYVSPTQNPFRHIVLGTGPHTLTALVDHLDELRTTKSGDVDLLKNQFALASWTIQACSNALAGEVWDMSNDI